jgi:uncharacterized membrane protein HdeD (DUF308 family)
MQTLNVAISVLLIIAGIIFTLFMWTQDPGWNIGMAIGIVLLLNGLVRFVFALGDRAQDDTEDDEW